MVLFIRVSIKKSPVTESGLNMSIIQNKEDMNHTYVKISRDTSQFPEFIFVGPH